MIDSFDYKEPTCALCGGKEFYNPEIKSANGRIPVDRIISKINECFNKNNFSEAGRLLKYWLGESILLKDTAGELSITSELVGYYRKVKDKEKCVKAVLRALELVDLLQQSEMASGATVFLNCATAYKAFGEPLKALELYLKAEKTYVKVLDKFDVRFAGLYNNMALTLVDLDKHSEAEIAYKKAVNIMQSVNGGQTDLAITYVNMAHLYEVMQLNQQVTDCLFNAYNLLTDVNVVKNGYYAYVCEKCAPSFEYFGYNLISEELKKVAKEIYERA